MLKVTPRRKKVMVKTLENQPVPRVVEEEEFPIVAQSISSLRRLTDYLVISSGIQSNGSHEVNVYLTVRDPITFVGREEHSRRVTLQGFEESGVIYGIRLYKLVNSKHWESQSLFTLGNSTPIHVGMVEDYKMNGKLGFEFINGECVAVYRSYTPPSCDECGERPWCDSTEGNPEYCGFTEETARLIRTPDIFSGVVQVIANFLQNASNLEGCDGVTENFERAEYHYGTLGVLIE